MDVGEIFYAFITNNLFKIIRLEVEQGQPAKYNVYAQGTDVHTVFHYEKAEGIVNLSARTTEHVEEIGQLIEYNWEELGLQTSQLNVFTTDNFTPIFTDVVPWTEV